MVNDSNNELQEISAWLKVNKLSLNIKKTHYMLFSNKKLKEDRLFEINIDGKLIDMVENTKFLGVYIDNKLNWKKHISHISGKVARGLGVILKARRVLNSNSLKTLYFSFIYPFFIYCNHVWGCTYETNLRPLITLQKTCIRIISSSKYRAHTDPLFKKLDLLKLVDINTYLIGKFMYRCHKRDVPELFTGIFISIQDVHNHDTRQRKQLYCPKINTNLGKTKFSYRGPHVWNRIINKIDPNTSEFIFSKSLRFILIQSQL